jgi:hypothetical protein
MNDGFELSGTPGKGDGVFATKPFKIGDTVMTGGIDKVVDGNNAHASQIGENQFVLHAGLISLVNHSCDPNCGVRVNETGANDFVARKTISANEEITFDYAMRNYTIDHFPKMCMCGSNMCRGAITGWKDLPFEKKQEYAGLVAPYLIALDARNSRERT